MRSIDLGTFCNPRVLLLAVTITMVTALVACKITDLNLRAKEIDVLHAPLSTAMSNDVHVTPLP